ncbi:MULTISPECIES: hypothetical protein [Streptomyces]|uniref:Uncharacterized protein n=1 Tax=Streptomyces dengpaensis TaxID=2049881 RepID=A0ABN5I9T9_9ACTN|nr:MULTISPECIES: hypothetical protein [Streptomyces]AVH59952.1 hypothetical protein C4B68_33925 [Streptomyces dengpaensis]PIB09587.1 hypothetical protein B1C81_10600 [Streptomyces sp. HG99]
MTDQPTARQRLLDAMRARTCFCGADSCQNAEPLVDAYAHELAEQQRHNFGIGDAPVKAHCDPACDFCRGVSSAADFIDPETQR